MMGIKTRRRLHTQGLSLVEVVVGIFITVLLTLSLLGLMTASEKVNKQAQVRSVALSIARQQLEFLSSQTALNRATVSDQEFPIADSVKQLLPVDMQGATLTGTYSIRNVSGASLQQIQVRVRWTNASANTNTVSGGPSSEVRISSLIAADRDLEWRPNGTTRDELFVPPPPPPPPPPPVPVTSGGSSGGTGGTPGTTTTGGSSGGSTGGSTGGSSGGSTGSSGGTSGGSTGGSTGGTSGGGGFTFDLYGSQLR